MWLTRLYIFYVRYLPIKIELKDAKLFLRQGGSWYACNKVQFNAYNHRINKTDKNYWSSQANTFDTWEQVDKFFN